MKIYTDPKIKCLVMKSESEADQVLIQDILNRIVGPVQMPEGTNEFKLSRSHRYCVIPQLTRDLEIGLLSCRG